MTTTNNKPADTIQIPKKVIYIIFGILITMISGFIKLVYQLDERLERMEITQGYDHASIDRKFKRMKNEIDGIKDDFREKRNGRQWGNKGKSGKPTGIMPTEHTIDPKPMPLPPWPVPKPDKPETVVCKSKTKLKENCSI